MRDVLVILLVVLLVFGTKKLRSLGADLGAAVKGFRKAASGDSAPSQGQLTSGAASSAPPDAEFPEVTEARSREREAQSRP